MNVEQELTQWLETHIPENRRDKLRNTKAVLLHYGFGDLAWPTLEEIGQQLSIGTRERVRQVLNANFKANAAIDQLPVLKKALDEIDSIDFQPIPELRRKLADLGVISEGTRIRGLLNLSHDLGVLGDFELVDHNLQKLSRSEAEFDDRTFIGKKATISELRRSYRKAKTLPGLLGLARFSYVREVIGDNDAADRIVQFIKLSADAEIVTHNDVDWYIFEGRDNTLINSCEKIRTVTATCNAQHLATALGNALRRRSHKYEYPSSEVIESWIYQSKWFEVSGNEASFLGEAHALTDIESAVVSYLSSVDSCSYPQIKDHLLQRGFGEPHVVKAVTTSPLVYVDKTGARKTYFYSLISNIAGAPAKADPNQRYRKFSNRLKRLASYGGTDTPALVLLRREQSILREWLFGGKEFEKCAICGKKYSVGALVTAHKKKRSDCTESERIDPWVVFPLCAFGCDYLFESRMVVIVDGKVVNTCSSETDVADQQAAKVVDGNVLDGRWMQGKSAYFGAT